MYLALRNISKRWTMPIKNWSGAMNQFAILFEGRVPKSEMRGALELSGCVTFYSGIQKLP
jgi:hypothetical protein